MRLIGLNGRLHSGKDTAVEYIRQAAVPANVERRAFADKLKLSAAWALGFEPRHTAEAVAICDALKETGVVESYQWVALWPTAKTPSIKAPSNLRHLTGREFLQRYGTEAHRDVFGQDFWVDALLPRPASSIHDPSLASCFPDINVLVITDVRFENEARRIRALGGEVWHLNADRRLGLPSERHASEQPLPDKLITLTVPNNGTRDQFGYAVQTAYELGDRR